MIPGRVQIRRYASEIRTLLYNLELNHNELDHWRDRDLHVLVEDPLDSNHLGDYAETRNQAAGMGLHIYPAFRTQASISFSFWDYISPAFWQTNADRLTNLAALRLPGDPWIGLDMESYAGKKPSRSALGEKFSQFRAAMKPFIVALRATNASVAVYPASAESGEDLLYVAEEQGRDRLELWTETTYMNSEHYRRSRARRWPVAAASFLGLMGQLQARFPGCLVRPGINDLERLWSDPYRLDLLRSGPGAPWGYDETRYDYLHLGTEMHRVGTALSELNRVRHVWPMQPMMVNVPAEFDTTLTATPKPLEATAENASGLPHPGWTASLHPDGLQFVTPAGLNTWAGLRGAQVLPNLWWEPFTVDGTLLLPVNPIDSCPLFGAVDRHIGSWQVVYDATERMIALHVTRPFPPPGRRKHYILPMMVAPPWGESLRVQVGRERNVWLHQASRTTLPADAGGRTPNPASESVWDSLIIGAGQAVSTFPQNNTLRGCPGIVLVGTWSIYDRLLSDTELAELRTVPRRYWPYGYGRGRHS